MKRIMIIGNAGSGKTTLAKQLSDRLDLPVVHGDHIQFEENWTLRSYVERERLFNDAASRDEWIIEGNYASTFETRAKRADAIIFLDMPTWLCLYRVLRRTIKYYDTNRPDMPEGCVERFDMEFIKFVATYFANSRQKALDLCEQYNTSCVIHHLKNKREVNRLVSSLNDA